MSGNNKIEVGDIVKVVNINVPFDLHVSDRHGRIKSLNKEFVVRKIYDCTKGFSIALKGCENLYLIKNLELVEKKKEKPKFNLLGQPIKDGDSMIYYIDTRESLNNNKIQDCKGYQGEDWSVFEKHDQAEKFNKKLTALKEIWDWKTLNDGVFNWEIDGSRAYGISKGTEGLVTMTCTYQGSPITPFYSSEDIAKKALIECKRQYNTLFDIK